MIASLLLVTAAVTGVAVPAVLDTALTAGLALTIDGIPEPLAVDGVSMAVQRVTGAGVPELARRIEAAWRRQGGQVEALQQGTWSIRSHFRGARSEVLQWRSSTDGAELLLSSVDVQAPVSPVAAAGLTLPAGCAWGRSIAGRSGTRLYMQRSARCPHSIHALSLQLRQSLVPQGWNVRSATDSGLQIDRPGAEGFISFSTHEGDIATWITWLRTESAP